jgi:hypothetical protein
MTKAKSVPKHSPHPRPRREPFHNYVVRRILNLPRPARMALVALFGLAATFAIFPLVDSVYLRFLFNEQTRQIPAYVSVGAGLVMYVLGWRLVVGTAGEEQLVRPTVLWYCVVGFAMILLIIILTLFGYSSATAPN